jgi:hypothetical protein
LRPGLTTFSQRFLQQLLSKDLIGQKSFQPSVLLFQFLEPFGLVQGHHSKLTLPAMEGLLADAFLPAYIHDGYIGSFSIPKAVWIILPSLC